MAIAKKCELLQFFILFYFSFQPIKSILLKSLTKISKNGIQNELKEDLVYRWLSLEKRSFLVITKKFVRPAMMAAKSLNLRLRNSLHFLIQIDYNRFFFFFSFLIFTKSIPSFVLNFVCVNTRKKIH